MRLEVRRNFPWEGSTMVVNVTNTMKGLFFVLLTPYIATICFVDIHCFVDFFFSRKFSSPSCLSFISLIDHTAIFLPFLWTTKKSSLEKDYWMCFHFNALRIFFILVCDCFDVKRFWRGKEKDEKIDSCNKSEWTRDMTIIFYSSIK